MRKTLLTALFASALAMTAIPATAAIAAAPDPVGDYIVVLRDGTDPSSFAGTQARSRGAAVDKIFNHALRGYSAKMSATAAAAVARDPQVQFVQPDGVVSINAQTLPTGVNRVDAELSPTAAINGVDTRVNVDVAIIDTGIQLNHPDLNVYTAGAKNCNTGTSANDGHGHGTHVAGTVGALDNTSSVVGVAPGARLWPVRVLNNSGGGSWSQVICGIDYVTAHASEIEVANMSLGGLGADDGNCGNTNNDAMHRAICAAVAAGVTFVVAAGNETDDAANHVPAAYDEVITVSALADFNGLPGGGAASTCRSDVDDTFAGFSNYGADVDIIAPGVCILSTWRSSGTSTISGTSMASPHVAGGAALYKATHPAATPAAVKSALQAAGTTNWNNADDPDGIKEKLLNVSTF
ncbi:S8 family serine peptidase [Streptosporangium canum]|uniref:Serine protease, subtilisin family n=1 Tax=Streptosporangium canum TaxID=324952 RepID=A0A1I4BDB9_9ACTN|nr:S8 family serine peptidase [Streptosporangium canum]SFK66523.1 Serine protease, subtilisin family [Streptosporangium canum]